MGSEQECNGSAPAPAEQPELQAPEEGRSTSKRCKIVEQYADLVADYPGAVCCAVLCVLCLFIMLCGTVAAMGDDFIVIDFSLDSMKSRGDEIANRDEALQAAWCGGPCEDDRRLRRRLDDHDDHWNTMTVAYVSKAGEGSNVLTESLLPQVLELERRASDVLGEPSYTVLPSFFPTYPSGSGMKTGEALQEELGSLAMLSTSDADTGRPWPSFDKNFTECDLSSSLLTSTFHADPYEWLDIYSDVLPGIETDDLYLTFFWGGSDDEPEVFTTERDNIISQDMFLLAGVILMVLVLLVLQTRSVFLSFIGMLAILLAMVTALCIYRVFVSNWFGILNSFSVFLLLGIACDDIFVLADAWRLTTESAGLAPDDYRGRLRHMLPRAGGAVTMTSLTTAGAFFGNAISIIPPTRLFGLFSGCLVLADWALTVFLLPAVLVLQHKWFGGTWCEHQNGAAPEPRMLDKLLARRFAPCVLRFAPVLLVFMAALTAVSFNVALEMKPAAEWHNSDILPSSYNQPRAYRAQQAMRNLAPEYAWLNLVYGVIPEDTGDMNDPKSKSDVSWGTPVDIAAPAVQQFVLDVCNELLAKRGLVRRIGGCWAQNAEAFAIEQGVDFPIQDASIFESDWNDWRWHGARRMPDGSGYWFNIDVEMTLRSDETVTATRAAHDEWEAFMESWNNEAKQRGLQSLSQGFQYSGRWRHMSTIEAMVNTAFTACCISSLIAAVFLLVTMQNVVMVLVILANVAAICLALVACFVIEGRGLGVLEGIAMTLIVGLSVDYLVHVAKAYLDTDKAMPRGQRTLHALAHLGGSVCVAAVTTILSAAFLCMGTTTFFTAFGGFVIGMMAFALMFTFFSLVPFLHLFGPEGGFGDVRCQKVCGSDTHHSEGAEETTNLTSGVQVHSVRGSIRLATMTAAVLVLLVGGAVQIGISVGRDSDDSVTCGAPTELEFTFEQYTIPAESDSYRCRDYDLVPATCTYYVTGWEPIIAEGSASFVHHMILFSTNRAVSQCTFTCFDMPDMIGVDASWAVGAGETMFPDGMALTIGGTKHALQMHYFNPALQSGAVDARSGLRLKLSPTPPTTYITTMMLGLHPMGDLNIPPYETNMTVFAECAPRLRGDVRVVAYNNHAHKLGIRITTEQRRPTPPGSFSTVAVGDVGNDLWYNFNYPRTNFFEEGDYRTIQPGDSIRIYCSYDSTSRTFTTVSGYGSEDEMCLTTLYLEPAENVVDNGCWTNRVEDVN